MPSHAEVTAPCQNVYAYPSLALRKRGVCVLTTKVQKEPVSVQDHCPETLRHFPKVRNLFQTPATNRSKSNPRHY